MGEEDTYLHEACGNAGGELGEHAYVMGVGGGAGAPGMGGSEEEHEEHDSGTEEADQEDDEDRMDGTGRTDVVQVDDFVKNVSVGGFEGDRPEMDEDGSSRVVMDNEDKVGRDVIELKGG